MEGKLMEQPTQKVLEAFASMPAIDRMAIVLAFTGGSVIDWRSLPIENTEQIEILLAANEIDLQKSNDRNQIRKLISYSVAYLEHIGDAELPSQVQELTNPASLIALASGLNESDPLTRRAACRTLKTLHILRNLMARQLLLHTRTTIERLGHQLFGKLSHAVADFGRSNGRLIDFETSEKTQTSMISKLLVTQDNLSSHIYDRLRCRITVEETEDVLQALRWLFNSVVPFNCILPAHSKNTLMPVAPLLESLPESRLNGDAARGDSTRRPKKFNDSSGSDYRALKFVTEIPVQISTVTDDPRENESEHLGSIVFVQTEIQIVDKLTARENEFGDNSHDAYKRRQIQRIVKRLG